MKADRGSGEDGAALIEAALVLPVLLIIIFAMADLALFLWQRNAALKAVHLGARRAIVSDALAAGPGLTRSESSSYWNDLPLGRKCAAADNQTSLCPTFAVSCTGRGRCACPGFGRCDYNFVEAKLTPVAEAMRSVMPALRTDQIEVSYATNALGYVGRPIPVPVNVTVRLVGVRYEFLFLKRVFGPFLSIDASATLPSEDLSDDARD